MQIHVTERWRAMCLSHVPYGVLTPPAHTHLDLIFGLGLWRPDCRLPAAWGLLFASRVPKHLHRHRLHPPAGVWRRGGLRAQTRLATRRSWMRSTLLVMRSVSTPATRTRCLQARVGNASSLTRCASAVHPPRETSSRRFRVDPLVNVFPRGSIGLSAIARPHRARGLVVHAGDAKVLVPSEGDTAAELVDYLNASWTHYHAVGEPSYRCLSLVSCAPSPALSALSTSPWAAAESKAMLLAAGFEQVSEREVISHGQPHRWRKPYHT